MLRPFYELVAAITAEELGHVELVSNGVAMLNNGPEDEADDEEGPVDISDAPFELMQDVRLAAAFLSLVAARCPWTATACPGTRRLRHHHRQRDLDLLHNFHLECGARLHKLRVYETLSDPTGREVCGYLLVRGSVHAHAYALALKKADRRVDREDAADAEHPARQHPGVPEVPAGKDRIAGSTLQPG